MNKKIVLFITIVITICMICLPVFGKAWDDLKPGTTGDPTNGATATVLGYIQWFGYALAVGMLIYIGIKYVMASAADKADLKKGLINYVIGAVIIAAASTIAGWIFSAGNTISGNPAEGTGTQQQENTTSKTPPKEAWVED